MEKKFNFVYCTINLIDWKMYIGDHSTNDLNHSKTKYYFGSGKLILKAIKKYSKENFIRIDLEFFNTKQEAFNAQEKYIIIFNTCSPNGYNISPKGGHNVKECISKETIEKMSKSHIGKKHSNQTKLKISNAHKGHIVTEETKNKISNANMFHIVSLEVREILRKKHKGKKRSKESIEKQSVAQIGKIPWNKNKKLSADHISKIQIKSSGENNGMFGRCWINNKIKNKCIKKEKLHIFLNRNWIKGKLQK